MALLELENPNASVNLTFEMDGPIFKEGMPIHILVAGLTEFQGILDKTYLGLIGRRKMTKDERSKFYLSTSQITKNSLHSDIGLIMTAGQIAFPFLNALGPVGIWEYTKQAYECLKLVFEAIKSGKTVEYTFTGNDSSILNINTGTITNTFNAPVFVIAQNVLPHYQAIDKLIEKDVVQKVSFGGKGSGVIERSADDKGFFELPSTVDENPIKLDCEIFDFNKFENIGKLHVFDGQSVAHGDYRFEVIGKQDVTLFIEAMLRTRVSVTCLQENAVDPFSMKKVVRLQVINVEK